MALSVAFTPKSMNTARYDEIIRQLEQAGQGAPQGRLYHVCFGSSDELRVTDIWNSVEELQQFGATLMPIAEKLGVDVGQPEITPVHNSIVGR